MCLFLHLVFAIDFLFVVHISCFSFQRISTRVMDFLFIDTYKFEALIFANSLSGLLFLFTLNDMVKSLCKILNALF